MHVNEAEEGWTADERQLLDEKLDRAREQVVAGRVCGPEEARRRLAALRDEHLSNPD